MSNNEPILHQSTELIAPQCPCGEYLKPDLVNVTGFDGVHKWHLTWQCEFEGRHKWKAAANGAE